MFYSKKVFWFIVMLCALTLCVRGRCYPEGDLNRDSMVDINDIGIFAGQWLGDSILCPETDSGDLNRSRRVDLADLAVLFGNFGATGVYAENIIFPSDAGVIDVTAPPYNAVPNDGADDTAAIQSAVNDHFAIIYLPEGVYDITGEIRFPTPNYAGIALQGQSTNGTILRIRDNAVAFQDPGNPRAVVHTGTFGSADIFHCYVRNLTIDTGSGNPGAIGIRFMSNNTGAVVDTKIRSGDGSGPYGLDLGFQDMIGPLLVKNVHINGFDTGVRCRHSVNSQTFEHVILEDQNAYGFANNNQVISFRGLISYNDVPAVYNEGSQGVLTLVDSVLIGRGASSVDAIVNNGTLMARNVYTCGYRSTGMGTEGDYIEEYVSGSVHTLFGTPGQSLNLPVEETPEVPWEQSLGLWANVTDFGAVADGKTDCTAGVQAAVDSGATTVYFPRNGSKRYIIKGTVKLRNKVKRVIGCEASLQIGARTPPVFELVDDPDAPDVVVFERFRHFGYNAHVTVRNSSDHRTLVCRNNGGASGHITGKGDVFIEDVVSNIKSNWVFAGRGHIWARQLNVETRDGVTHVINDASKLWILGYKTEMAGVLIETRNGGKTEVLGHFSYTVGGGDPPKEEPMYIVDNSSMSTTLGESYYGGGSGPYLKLVEESLGAQTRLLNNTDTPSRGNGSIIPLFVARHVEDTEPPAAPEGLSAAALSSSRINLDWDDNGETDLAGYNVYRSQTSGFVSSPNTRLASGIETSQYIDGELDADTTYYYKVTAVDTWDNESGASGEAYDSTLPPDTTAPDAPADLTAVAVGALQIDLDWNDNSESDLAGYNVYGSQMPDFVPDVNTLIAEGVQFSHYSDTDLEPETTYYYKVTSVDDSHNESTASGRASAVTGIYTGPAPAARWRLDENSGLVAADANGTNDGTLRHMTGDEWTAGQVDNALVLDGTDDHVEMVGYKGITGDQNRTVSAWIKSDTGGVILSWGDTGQYGRVRWIFKAGGSDIAGGGNYNWGGRVGVDLNWGAAIGTTEVLDSQWHHVAAVLDNSSLDGSAMWHIALYVDGQLETLSTWDRAGQTLGTNGTENVEIGAWVDGHHFEGIIDDVTIWDTALTPSEIMTVYNNGIQ